MISWLSVAQAQEVMNVVSDFLPNRTDTTNDFFVFARIDYMFPQNERTTTIQTERLGDMDAKPQLWGGEFYMQMYKPDKRNRDFEPYLSVDMKGYPMHYMSSSIGIGVTCRPLRWSLGVKAGKYYRQVASDGNFVTRRSKEFDTYPMWGAYMQVARKHWTFLFSTTVELNDTYSSTRVTSRLGETLNLGKTSPTLRSLEAIVAEDMFTGFSAGISLELVPQMKLEALLVVPYDYVRDEVARLGYKFTNGVLVRVACYVN